jgi:hypothetical protein
MEKNEMNKALNVEVKGFGIKVTLVEPTGSSIDWGGSSSFHAEHLSAYTKLYELMQKMSQARVIQVGNPKDTGSVILKLADMNDPPLRVFFGKGPLDAIHKEYAETFYMGKICQLVTGSILKILPAQNIFQFNILCLKLQLSLFLSSPCINRKTSECPMSAHFIFFIFRLMRRRLSNSGLLRT